MRSCGASPGRSGSRSSSTMIQHAVAVDDRPRLRRNTAARPGSSRPRCSPTHRVRSSSTAGTPASSRRARGGYCNRRPKFRTLPPRLPAMAGAAAAKTPVPCAAFFLVPPCPAERGVETVFVERLLQGLGLHNFGMQRRPRGDRIDAARQPLRGWYGRSDRDQARAPSRRETRSSRETSRSCRYAAAGKAALPDKTPCAPDATGRSNPCRSNTSGPGCETRPRPRAEWRSIRPQAARRWRDRDGPAGAIAAGESIVSLNPKSPDTAGVRAPRLIGGLAAVLQRFAQRLEQKVFIKRLCQIRGHPHRHRPFPLPGRRRTRYQDYRDAATLGDQMTVQSQSGHSRHADIEDQTGLPRTDGPRQGTARPRQRPRS